MKFNFKLVKKRLITIFLSASIFATSGIISVFAENASIPTQNYIEPYNYGVRVVSNNERVYFDRGIEITYKITSQWSGNQVVNLIIKNTGSEVIENWALFYDIGGQTEGMWSAKVKETEYFSYLTHDTTNAGDIQPNQTVSVGYTLKSEEKYFPEFIEMCQTRLQKEDGYSVSLSGVYDTWNGFAGNLLVKNETNEIIYKPEITFTANFELQSNWDYDILKIDSNVYIIRSKWDKIITITPNGQILLEISGLKINNTIPQISDISLTEVTVSAEAYVEKDSDMDGLPDYYEMILGTNKYNPDTDGDGLPDGYEVFTLGTNPLLSDTDSTGISDADEDFDNDGLININEYLLGTNPFNPDSDDDGLSDGDEVYVYGTNPLNPDTDGDGLLDGEEGYNGIFYTKYGIYFDPLNPDTNGNGILDGDEKIEQDTSIDVVTFDNAITNISVEMNTNGNLDRNLNIESVYGIDVMSSEVVGLVGEPFDFTTPSSFDEAKITFTIDKDALGETNFEDLLFLYYNEETLCFEELETIYDDLNNTVSIITTHFSKYMIVNSKEWNKAWQEEIKSEKFIPVYSVLAIDCSSSMGNTTDIRKNAAEAFINSMRYIEYDAINNITYSNDKSAIMRFEGNSEIRESDWLQHLTSDKSALLTSLSGINSSGGTLFEPAITAAIKELKNADSNNETNKIIIFLSDGYGENLNKLDNILEKARDSGIKIYTIGIGSSFDENTLTGIAKATDGEFYLAGNVDGTLGLDEIYMEISNISQMDLTDDDDDKLPDFFETHGIQVQNGTKYYTNPKIKDSDKDDIIDGEEIEFKAYSIKYRTKLGPVYGVTFKYHSDPNNADTDGDGIIDSEDLRPVNPAENNDDIKGYSQNPEIAIKNSKAFVVLQKFNNSIPLVMKSGYINNLKFYPDDKNDKDITVNINDYAITANTKFEIVAICLSSTKSWVKIRAIGTPTAPKYLYLEGNYVDGDYYDGKHSFGNGIKEQNIPILRIMFGYESPIEGIEYETWNNTGTVKITGSERYTNASTSPQKGETTLLSQSQLGFMYVLCNEIEKSIDTENLFEWMLSISMHETRMGRDILTWKGINAEEGTAAQGYFQCRIWTDKQLFNDFSTYLKNRNSFKIAYKINDFAIRLDKDSYIYSNNPKTILSKRTNYYGTIVHSLNSLKYNIETEKIYSEQDFDFQNAIENAIFKYAGQKNKRGHYYSEFKEYYDLLMKNYSQKWQ